jgi:hypothetical protein
MNKLETTMKILESFPAADPTGLFSINYNMAGSVFSLNYSSIVNFASESSLQPQLIRAREQALQLIDTRIGDLKSQFRETAGETLQLEDLGGTDDLEVISATSNSPRKISYFRLTRKFEVKP